MNKIKQFIKEQICRVFGHKEVWWQEFRPRIERHNASWKNCKVKEVRGTYKKCERCGKKLSNWTRL